MTAALVIAGVPSVAEAQGRAPSKHAASPAKQRAAELFKRSADAYLRGDFEGSIKLLDEAYALDPQPVLVYNKARAQEGLGRLDEAIQLYEQYLRDEPTSRDRGAIEQRLTTLRRQREEKNAVAQDRETMERQRASAPPPAAAPPEAEPAPRARSIGPFVLGGLGVLGLGAGTVLGVLASSREQEANDAPVQTDAIDERDSAKSLATAANVGFVAGGVLLLAGATWFVADGFSRSKPRGARSTLRVGVGPMFVGVGGSFQ